MATYMCDGTFNKTNTGNTDIKDNINKVSVSMLCTGQPIEKSVGMQKVVIISHQSFKKNYIVQTKESLQEKPHYIMSHLCHISFMCYYSLGLILFNQKCKQRRCRLPPCCRAATAKGNCCGSLLPIKRCGHLFFVPSF